MSGEQKDQIVLTVQDFTRYVYLQVTGKDIGGWTVPQETAGTMISVSQAQAGDLLFWGAAGSTHHVAISLEATSTFMPLVQDRQFLWGYSILHSELCS